MSQLNYHFRSNIMPVVIMSTTPFLNVLVHIVCRFYDGSIMQFLNNFSLDRVVAIWPTPDATTLKIVFSYAVFEALLLIFVPGRIHKGPITPQGNQPTYRLNGVACYWISTFTLLAGFYSGYIPLGLVYDQFGKIINFVTFFSFFLCFLLYCKGNLFPSSSDSGSTGSVIWDFYWGMELHPQIGNFNFKQFCNCRLGMMSWNLILLCFAAKQYEVHGYIANSMIASVLLQEIYVFKFFVWEGGYFGSLDVMHDRFGWYICWGVLSWIAGNYTLTGQWLVNHIVIWSDVQFFAIVALGTFCIWANWDADAQRQRVRETEGECKIWGRPAKVIHAKYTTGDGKVRETLLLNSGWWSIARHFHYNAEISAAFFWCIPAGVTHFLPLFYVFYLIILLVDRSYRDEVRCSAKYGKYWKQYCKEVPYSIIPGIY